MSAQRKLPAKQVVTPKLSAPLASVRRQFLNKVKNLTPEDAIETLREGLGGETLELARLGNLAAQSWIVRQRLTALQQQTGSLPTPDILPEEEDQTAEETTTEASTPPQEQETPVIPQAAPVAEGWQKVRITKETEVNGMIFFAGSTIQVQSEDAQKLIDAGQAEQFSEEEPPAAPRQKSKSKAGSKK